MPGDAVGSRGVRGIVPVQPPVQGRPLSAGKRHSPGHEQHGPARVQPVHPRAHDAQEVAQQMGEPSTRRPRREGTGSSSRSATWPSSRIRSTPPSATPIGPPRSRERGTRTALPSAPPALRRWPAPWRRSLGARATSPIAPNGLRTRRWRSGARPYLRPISKMLAVSEPASMTVAVGSFQGRGLRWRLRRRRVNRLAERQEEPHHELDPLLQGLAEPRRRRPPVGPPWPTRPSSP